MPEHGELQGRRIAVLAADGFELVEVAVPVKAFRAAGARVDIVSLRPGRIRGMNLHEPGIRMRVTRTLDEAGPEDYDGLMIPGGFINPDLLRQSARAREFARAFDSAGKPIATLCHGPWLLASAGVTGGRMLTSWPGIRDDLVHAGATWLDQELVRDGNWVSSRGPQDILAFTRGAVQLFSETGPFTAETRQRESAPQRDAPPQAVLRTMKWLPHPSVRMVAWIAALGAGMWMLNRSVSHDDRQG